MNDQAHIRVFSVDDHPLFNEGLAAFIKIQPDMQLVGQVTSGGDAVRQFAQYRPDVTLMDLRLPDMSGIEAMIAIRAEFPEARIIMLTTFEGDVEIQRALGAGARGYLLKSMPPGDLVAVIRRVHGGTRHIASEVAAPLAEHPGDEELTPRELAALRTAATGNPTRDIGPK